MITIQLLGGFGVWQDGQPGPRFPTQKARALLAYLAYQADQAQPRSVLADLLWPDASAQRSAHNLRQALTFLRQGLAEGHAAANLIITRQSVRLTPGPALQIDILNLAHLLATDDRTAWAEAVALYHGPLLAGFYLDDAPEFETWLLAERERWQATILSTLSKLADFHRVRGEYNLARTHLQHTLSLDPWHEQAYRELMRLQAMQGDRAGALAQFEKARQALKIGLGVTPLPETEALADQIRQGIFPPSPSQAQAWVLPFVGRGAEHARLAAAFTFASRPRLVLLEGVSGLGKTRLMTEFSHYATAHGTICLPGRCLAYAVPVPYQPLVMILRAALPHHQQPLPSVWLAELARLLPELTRQYPNLPPLPTNPDPTERQRLFTAVAHLLASVGTEQQPLMLLLDDLHWADTASLDLLQFLLHAQLPRLLAIGTVRPEDTPAEHPLTRLRRGLSREHLVEVITLTPLTEGAVRTLVAHWVGADDAAAMGDFLARESEGNPFVLSELVYDLVESLTPDPGPWVLPANWRAQIPRLTPALRDVVLDRVERLPPASLQALQIAAVIGHSFDLATVAEISQQSVDGFLDDWQMRHLVQWRTGAVEFAHDKIRAVLYETIPPTQRQRWHEATAQILQRQEGVAAGILAHHFYHSPDPTQALPYLLQAAEEASHLLALAEVITLCNQALAISPISLSMQYELFRQRQRAYQFGGDTEGEGRDAAALVHIAQQTGEPRQLAEAVQRLGRFYYLRGQISEARQTIMEIVNLARMSGQVDVAVRVLNMVAMLFRETVAGQAEALRYQAEALGLARAAANPQFEAMLMCDTAVLLAEKGDWGEALRLAQAGLALLRQEKAEGYLPHALYILGGLWREIGQMTQAQDRLDEALALCQQQGIGTYLLSIHLERGRLALERDQLTEARQSYAQVQQLAEQAGRSLIVGKAHLGLGWVAYQDGDFTQAHLHLEQAIALCGQEELRTQLIAQALLGLTWLGLDQVAKAVAVIEVGMAIAAAGERVLVARPQLYWTYYRILTYAGRPMEARDWLQMAQTLLITQSARLPDPWRETFLNGVPVHHHIYRTLSR
jgi:DNA-binding SARP family transcriptional activator